MRYVLGWALCLCVFISNSQPSEEGYYLFPINPGQPNYLAGTMGELRASHFHAGIDIKTGGVTGLPVYATADGYISRIKISTGGYGHALYMNHPNGTISVYAHLKEFTKVLQDAIVKQQYSEEDYQVQIFPKKGEFNFKKGDIIAYSGNTGSSSGPHLHFEIRDANHQILDPLKFKFDEIKDDIAPRIKNIAFVTLDDQARINQMFGRYAFDVIPGKEGYTTRTPIDLKGNIGIEIYAYDQLNGVYNRNGISETTLVIDEDTVFRELKESMSFSTQRHILVHMDYEAYRNGSPKYNKLFVDDGNENDFYVIKSKGHTFNDEAHSIKILMKDTYGNVSVFQTEVNARKVVYPPSPSITNYEIFRNYLHIVSSTDSVALFRNGKAITLAPYRSSRKHSYYTYDLRQGLPDSVFTNSKIISTHFQAQVPSASSRSFHHPDLDLSFNRTTLFDTLYLQYKKETLSDGMELFHFPHQLVPFRGNVTVSLKPNGMYDEKTARVYEKYGRRLSYVGGDWENNAITFQSRELSAYTIASDTLAPTIDPRIVNQKELYFKIYDDLSGIKSFRATLNGEFLLMYYESKRNLIWAVPQAGIPLEGHFILTVEDLTGNVATYEKKLTYNN